MDWRRWIILASVIVNMCVALGGLHFIYSPDNVGMGSSLVSKPKVNKKEITTKKAVKEKKREIKKRNRVFSPPPQYTFHTDTKKDLQKFKQNMTKFGEVVE